MRREFYIVSYVVLIIQGVLAYFYPISALSFILTLPLFIMGVMESRQTSSTLLRNYPILGKLRYVMEELRPKIYQYFIESDTDGRPFSRIFRSVIYQRAKNDVASTPFGTQVDVYAVGYEWINHSMRPLDHSEIKEENLRVNVGGKDCKKPYSLSIYNISAMSFGSLSSNAIESLNWGAKVGNFAHNTGEGSISPFHLKHGGDLIWQIGTGYFGCRTSSGGFDSDKFKEKANLDNVKMIEIKLSQGAKPGHGGILPAKKNTAVIAAIRGVEPNIRIDSPPAHKAFSDDQGLLDFIVKLRDLSGGKPVGFKFCFGNTDEFENLCALMQKTNILPDFITVDGGEGGTGAAPLEFSNSIGMALKDGLILTDSILKHYGLRDKIKILASGKVTTGFDIIRTIALGADACYTARGMMMALGCIQALLCNKNTCPVGVATQDPSLTQGLIVSNKFQRVVNFHRETVHSVLEILAAAGLRSTDEIAKKHIWRRISTTEIRTFEDLYESHYNDKVLKVLNAVGGV